MKCAVGREKERIFKTKERMPEFGIDSLLSHFVTMSKIFHLSALSFLIYKSKRRLN